MINIRNITKIYNARTVPVHALRGLSFKITPGEFIGIMGPSGSGKSTLLHILGLLDNPTKGTYSINNLNIAKLPEEQRSFYRLTQVGYVFQEYALIEEMTSLGNVSLPLIMKGLSKKEAEEKGREALDLVGLKDKYDRTESELSGGERQRVAIARAIVGKPQIIFADEPCANLDTATSAQVLDVFKKLNKELGLTIVMVTHEDWHIKYVSRIIKLTDGLIVLDKKRR